ncbi:winged helix-turn-helix domain-containing protein, partial [Pseudomonas aeruginosa]|uniref:winged helix-turn-helix domain-containing protein n=1 Tax=Pseudomonas aeruginosa TaxID=287 RepID=UPI00211A024E
AEGGGFMPFAKRGDVVHSEATSGFNNQKKSLLINGLAALGDSLRLNRSVDVCISKLRNKLKDNPREPVRIKTVWGKGYLFNPLGWEL